MLRFALPACFLGGALFAIPSPAPNAEPQDSPFDSVIRTQLELSRYDLLNLDLEQAALGPQRVEIALDGLTYTFDLTPHSSEPTTSSFWFKAKMARFAKSKRRRQRRSKGASSNFLTHRLPAPSSTVSSMP